MKGACTEGPTRPLASASAARSGPELRRRRQAGGAGAGAGAGGATCWLLLLLFCCCWFWGPLLPLGPILAASSCGKRGRREEEKREGRGEEGEEEGLSYLSQGRFEKKTADARLALDGAFRSSRLLPSFFSSIPLLLMTHLARALAPVAHCGSELSCWCARVAGEEERRGYGRSERERKKRFGTMKTTPWFSLWREKIASRSRPRSESPNSKTPPRAHMRSSGSHGPRERERERRKKGAQRRVNEVFARLFFGDDARDVETDASTILRVDGRRCCMHPLFCPSARVPRRRESLGFGIGRVDNEREEEGEKREERAYLDKKRRR